MTIEQALDRLLEVGGSDLLISCGSPPRLRRDGRLEALEGLLLTPAAVEPMVRGLLDESQWQELQTRRNVDFAFTWRERVRIRGNAYFQRGSLAAAFRMLPLRIPTFEELGVPESVYKLIDRHQGLILVTGPTGSGKSTTLAAMIDYVNRNRPCHIVTVEDPIEYVHLHQAALVDQRQVGIDTPSFVEALRAVFREDPDVVLIGEMRDLETMASALSIAETGHLVLATVHTNDASQAVDRILDAFPTGQVQQARVQLAACLAGVIYQQLLPAVGGGRVAAFEILMATSAVRSLIKEGKTNQIRNVMQTSLREGSQTLERSLSQLLQAGMVAERDARSRSLYPQEIG
jgi:twitching motility protein PilT